MTLPLHIAHKLMALLQGAKMPASGLKHQVVTRLLAEGILEKQQLGRSKSLVYLSSPGALNHYLQNQFGIADLQVYIDTLLEPTAARADGVLASSNSKLKPVRTFTGFMVATLQQIEVLVNNQPFTLMPHAGIHFFVSDYEHFIVPQNATIVGVENAENFLHLQQQAHLFTGINPLFVCRYPYSSDLRKWLLQIPNNYLHYGDIDFAGISIFLNEYYQILGGRASFFIPPHIEELLARYGNRNL